MEAQATPISQTSEQPPHATEDRSVAARWSTRLATRFCPVPTYFLENYHRLRPGPNANGLSSTEAMVVIHLVSFKWSARAPFPTVGTIAERMGLHERSVRAAVRNLEQLGYLKREFSRHGGPNRYHFDGLIQALEALMDQDLAAADADATKKDS